MKVLVFDDSGKLFHMADEVISWKIWQEDDVRMRLNEKGYDDCLFNVNTVLGTHYTDTLADCTDQDWDIIDQAIYAVEDELYEFKE